MDFREKPFLLPTARKTTSPRKRAGMVDIPAISDNTIKIINMPNAIKRSMFFVSSVKALFPASKRFLRQSAVYLSSLL